MIVISFKSTHTAMKLKKILKQNEIKNMTIPVPRAISNSCGIALKIEKEDISKIKQISKENNIEYSGLYEIDGDKAINLD